MGGLYGGGSIRWVGQYGGGSIRWAVGGLYGGWFYTVGVYTVGGSIRGVYLVGVYKGGWVYTVGGLYRGVYLVGILYGMRSIGWVYCFFFPFGLSWYKLSLCSGGP